MNWDIILFFLFIALLYIFYKTHKSKFEVQQKIFFIYRTQLGIRLMDKISRLPKQILHVFSVLAIATGFAGMIMMFYIIVKYTFKFILAPAVNQPVLSPVLPGIKIPGVGSISFFHWIIAIFIVAAIHEFSHGFIARFFNVKIKSSGFLFFGPLLGAFVEPDEDQMSKKSKYSQLSIMSAGPFSNILTGLIFFIVFILITPPISNMYEPKGVEVVSVDSNYPAYNAGIKSGETIQSINNFPIKNLDDFSSILNKTIPGQEISIETNLKTYSLTLSKHPQDAKKGFLGIRLQPSSVEIKDTIKSKYGVFIPKTFLWIYQLFKWLFLVSIGIALFNLLPLGPFDGGRMFLTVLIKVFKEEKKAKFIWMIISFFLLALIVVNLWPLIKKLFLFIFTPILGV